MRTPLRLLLLLVLLIHLLSLAASASLLSLHHLSAPALCNDRSPAAYYLLRNTTSTRWIVYLESGGGCSDTRSCAARWKSSHILMSSSWLDNYPTLQGLDVLEEGAEPFGTYNKVYLPYCSSDMYLGMEEGDGTADFNVTDLNFIFSGRYIVRELFTELEIKAGDQVVMVGSSAGGIGVMNHIKLVRESLETKLGAGSVSVRGIVDSAWFINFEGNFEEFWDSKKAQDMTQFENFPIAGNEGSDLCARTYAGIPCCFQADCLEHHGAFEGISIFFITSKHDIYFLASSIVSLATSLSGFSAIGLSQIADTVARYSGAMMMSMNTTIHGNCSHFITTCLQHVYLAPSSLWREGQPLSDLDQAGFNNKMSQTANSGGDDTAKSFISFVQYIKPEAYLKVKIGPTLYPEHSLGDAISTWEEGEGNSPFYWQDGCVGVQCNPSCPEQLTFLYSSYFHWNEIGCLVVMALLGALSLFCLIWKMTIWIQLRRLLIKQSEFTRSTVSKENFIPLLSDDDLMSVSCYDLSHSIYTPADNAEASPERNSVSYQKLKEDLERQPSVDNAATLRQRKTLDKRRTRLSALSATMTAKKQIEKVILDRMTIYFNPYSFVGIMGPSGCGKTTFLDLLAGRQKPSKIIKSKKDRDLKQEILVDCQNFATMKDEYRNMLAYVMQLEKPYHENLTVRENLTFEALMRLPKDCPLTTVFHRVETILKECGLDEIAESKVGSESGGGISGGQKRRLCVALQLIDYPSIIFLDEPTSGLDATSSFELMTMLSRLQVSKRCIVLTIHQPRQEIFHLFTHILLLTGGQVAYYGSPLHARSFLESAFEKENKSVSDFLSNPDSSNNIADMLMDLINQEDSKRLIIKYYRETELPSVREIIERSRQIQPSERTSVLSKKKMQVVGGFNRMILALESRVMLQQSTFQMLYLPLIFALVPCVLGWVYFKEEEGLLIISVYCVVTCMGPLFLTSVIMNLINDSLRVFLMQYNDGIGSLYHIVFMVFYRMVGITTIPMIICSIIIYLMVIISYDFFEFAQVTVMLLALCQAWIGVFSAVVYSGPSVALRVCPMVSAVSAFTSGFLVPEPQMPFPLRYLFQINPTFWAMKAITKVLLENKLFGCDTYTSKLTCQGSSGNFNLHTFGFLDGNPTITGIVLLSTIILTHAFSLWILVYKYSKEPMLETIQKNFIWFRDSIRCPVVPRGRGGVNKVGDGTLVISDVKRSEAKKEWATIIGRVMSQQQDAVDAEEDARRIIRSSIMEGVGHFVYRRGTNSEKILERHTRSYRTQNGVSDEMLQEVVAILKAAVRTPGSHLSNDHEGKKSLIPGIDSGTRTIKHAAGVKVHEIVSDFRRRRMLANASRRSEQVPAPGDQPGSTPGTPNGLIEQDPLERYSTASPAEIAGETANQHHTNSVGESDSVNSKVPLVTELSQREGSPMESESSSSRVRLVDPQGSPVEQSSSRVRLVDPEL